MQENKLSYIKNITTKRYFLAGCGCSLIVVIIIVVLVVQVIRNSTISNSNNSQSGQSNQTTQTLTSEQCAPDVSKYDRKVLKINGNDIQGTIGITADAQKCQIIGHIHLLINANLASNPVDQLPYLYNYVVSLYKPSDTDRKLRYYTGLVSPAYMNTTLLPSDAFTDNISSFYAVNDGNNGTTVSNVFFTNSYDYEELSENGYQKMFEQTMLDIADSNPYQIKSAYDGPGGGYQYIGDTLKAAQEGTIIRTFSFVISE